jgi:P-type conjugative transfer protein TrbJ
MKTTMKKIGLSTALATMLLSSSLNAGGAVSGGASEWTQIAQLVADGVDRANQYTAQLQDYAMQIQQYQQQVQQYVNQYNSYKMMLENIGQLPQQQWDQFSQSVLKLKEAVNFGEGINFAASSYNNDFSKLFKGYDQYLAGAKDGSLDFGATYKQLNQSTTDTVNGALKSLGLQAEDMQSDESTMRQLQALSSNATGQKAAIQAASEIALHQTHTLKKLQQTVMTQANMQGEYIAKKNEENTLKDAAFDAFKSNVELPDSTDNKPMP